MRECNIRHNACDHGVRLDPARHLLLDHVLMVMHFRTGEFCLLGRCADGCEIGRNGVGTVVVPQPGYVCRHTDRAFTEC